MTKNRLEAFSDGVIAIIITIMVLELQIPHSPDWSGLRPLIPKFLSYALSFLYLGIYWGNHHHLLHTVKRVNSAIIWSNTNLLFWLSLVPFVTGWMGENSFSRNTVILYAVDMLLCGASYYFLQKSIMSEHQFEGDLKDALEKSNRKGIISLVCYSAAIPLAFVNSMVSGIIFLVVSVMWLIPEKSIEKALSDR